MIITNPLQLAVAVVAVVEDIKDEVHMGAAAAAMRIGSVEPMGQCGRRRKLARRRKEVLVFLKQMAMQGAH